MEVVALLNDDKGIPQTAERRLEVFADLMRKLKNMVSILPDFILTLIEMLCTSEDGIKMVTDVIHAIKAEYPTIHISVQRPIFPSTCPRENL
jgi:5-methyltetrahydrofolate--homocysteine methyltransferase